MDAKTHWETIYRRKPPHQVSWYRPHLDTSMALLTHAGLNPLSKVIDVGAGASTLIDDLLALQVNDVTVLDIAGHALATARARLGNQAERVKWIEGDITQVRLESGSYDIWHDRAAFHFLMNTEDRCRYAATMARALKAGGQAVIATFSLYGPPRCSGLDVVRYTPESLQAELGAGFRFAESIEEEHRTPFETTQHFLYCRFERGQASAEQ